MLCWTRTFLNEKFCHARPACRQEDLFFFILFCLSKKETKKDPRKRPHPPAAPSPKREGKWMLSV